MTRPEDAAALAELERQAHMRLFGHDGSIMPLDGLDVFFVRGAFNLRALVDAVLAAQWRPIETAPRDGTIVLVFDPAKGVNTARWDRLNGWMAMPGVYDRKPTHWQPLGRPPTAA